ncbi:MAG: lipopolysaccharide biosynthesis protein [Thermoguttaceae bacterium]
MRVGNYLRQLAGESLIYGIPQTINALIGLVLMPVITAAFTTAEYGVYTLVEGAFALLTMFAILGLDNASARWFYDSDDLADRRRTVGSWFWCQVAISLTLAAVLVGFAPAVSRLLTNSAEYAVPVALMGAVLPFQAAQRVFANWLRYQRRAWAAVTFATSTAVGIVGLVSWVVLIRRQGLVGFYLARLAVFVLAAAWALWFLRGWVSWKTFSAERLRRMLLFGLPFVPVALGTWAMRYTDRFILDRFCGKEEVALFGAAFQIAMGVGVVVTAFTQAWGPFAFSLIRHRQSREVYARVLDMYAFLGCLLCTAVALAAPVLVQVLARRPAYSAAASCVAFLAFGCLFNGARFIAATGLHIIKKSVPSAVSAAIGFSTSLSLNFLLIPAFGRNGAALASMMAWLVSLVYLFAASQRNYPIPYRWSRSLACLACSFAIVGIDRWGIASGGAGAWLLRAGLLLLFVPLAFALGLGRRPGPEDRQEPLRETPQADLAAAIGAPDAAGAAAVAELSSPSDGLR